MKTIGIIGGVTWLSSAEYYRVINEMVNKELGGVHSAKILLHSVDFDEIKTLTFAGDWQGIAAIMCKMAQDLEKAGAGCILLGANTMHKIAADIQAAVSIPLIHIATATGAAIGALQLKKVALLGTRYTMELGFYQEQLEKFGITTIIPGEADRQYVHDAIYEEMGKNIFLDTTKQRIINIIQTLMRQGAEGVILGCTEIPLLVKQSDSPIPVFDTGLIHASAAVSFALNNL